MERVVEAYLVDKVKAMGGLAFKWVSPGADGVPDRIIIWPGGIVHFIEVKEHTHVRAIQRFRLNELRKKGCTVMVLKGKEEVNEYINTMAVSVTSQGVDT